MALAGIDALRVLQEFRHSDDQIRRRFLAQDHVLNDIHSDVYVSGTYVRDYLLDPDPQRAETYRASLENVHRHMESALASYGSQVAAPEIQHYAALRTELTGYWKILAPISHWDQAERRRSGYAFLRDEVFPRRQNMLAVADRIANINEQQLNAGNEQVVSLLLRFQDRLILTLVAALIVGLGMALFTMRKILKLEHQERLRYEEVADARSQLKDLSARLVQAQETERRALSRELHDEVGQSLSAVLIELRNLSAGLRVRSEEQTRGHVETVKGLVESHRPGSSQHGPAAAAFHVGRPGADSRAEMAGSRMLQAHLDGCQCRGRARHRRSSGRIQDLHLSRRAGSAAQLRASLPCDDRPHPRRAKARPSDV